MAFEKLAVLGAGAIGSCIGAYLARAGRDITLIDLWPAHVEEMKRRGLTVTAQDEEFTVPVQAVHLAAAVAFLVSERASDIIGNLESVDGELHRAVV